MKKLWVPLVWLGLWQLAFMAVNLPLLLPSPAQVAGSLLSLCVEGGFWLTVGQTCLRVLWGFVLAAVVGTGLAALSYWLAPVKAFVLPALGVIKATPVASFIILALVWVKSGQLTALIAFLMVVPIFFNNVMEGIGSADCELLEMASAFSLSRWRRLRHIYTPAVKPFFLSALTSGIGFAWKSGIAAEVLGHPNPAIGTEIYNAKIYLETADLFAWTLVVIVLSMVIEKVLVWAIGGDGRR